MRGERSKVVKGEFYSRWGSELLPSALASLRPSLFLSLFPSLLFLLQSLDRLRVMFRGVRREDSGSLRRHQTLYVVTAVIATDYILLWDLLLQRLHTLRGQVVANLFHRLEHPYKIQTSQLLDVFLRPSTR